jgi:hypothetical protein
VYWLNCQSGFEATMLAAPAQKSKIEKLGEDFDDGDLMLQA